MQSYPDYLDLRDRNLSFDGLAAYRITEAGLDTGQNPSRVFLCEVSGNHFDALRIPPYLGRFFHASDERGPNSAPYLVLSYAFWHTHFQDGLLGSGQIKELGIRIAIGARPKEVLQTALGRAFKLLAFGSAAGLVLGILATRVLAAIVYQATPRDPLVLAGSGSRDAAAGPSGHLDSCATSLVD